MPTNITEMLLELSEVIYKDTEWHSQWWWWFTESLPAQNAVCYNCSFFFFSHPNFLMEKKKMFSRQRLDLIGLIWKLKMLPSMSPLTLGLCWFSLSNFNLENSCFLNPNFSTSSSLSLIFSQNLLLGFFKISQSLSF